MKRILIIVILISYSIVSFGVGLNYFYCFGKLKSVSIAVESEPQNCITESRKGCCDNKIVILKLKTDQKSNEQAAFHLDLPLSPIIYTYDYSVANLATNGNINPLYKRPAPNNLPSRNILFCVFRI